MRSTVTSLLTSLALSSGALWIVTGCYLEIPVSTCDDDHPCTENGYCDYPQGKSCGRGGALGLCIRRPTACPEYASPVCGCDAVTYDNPCFAYAAGVDVARQGACDDPCVAQDADGRGLCDLFLGWFWDGASCVGQSGCYCEGIDCAHGWDTLESCTAAHASCLEPPTCGEGTSCAATDWCDWPDASMCGQSGGTGVCRDRPEACPAYYHPVCGCDGVTYGNGCEANAAGTDVAYDGECGTGEICGGLAGFVCPDTEWCDYPADAMCGAADQTGVCRPRPDVCSLLYAPVCGCDGRTYANECVANAAGVDVAYGGACTDGSCNTGGATCDATEWCDVTDGAACDAPGICRPRPDVCARYWSPVCGCDDVTYGNECEAHRAGTDVSYPGECGAACAVISTLARTCTSDASCFVALHQINCCGTEVATGLSTSERTRFEMLEPVCRASYPACGCPTMQTTTDTGELVTDPSQVRVGCIARGPAGICMTYVTTRPPDGV